MPEFDVVIKGGTIFDGAGNPRYRADIGLKAGVIAEIGAVAASDARRVVDAAGLNVAPGYIDLHTHYDAQLFWDPYCSPASGHGVTTVVVGNCGLGFAPVPSTPEDREFAMLLLTHTEAIPLASMRAGMPWDWASYPEYLDSVARTPKSVNVLGFTPLNPVMIAAMGLERARAGALPTDAEHAEMRRIVGEALDAGAAGWSAQRLGRHSIQRDHEGNPMPTDLMHDETLWELARPLAERGKGVVQYTYIDFDPLSARTPTDKAIMRAHYEELARVSGRPLLYALAPGPDVSEELGWLRRCREQGVRVVPQGLTIRSGESHALRGLSLSDDSVIGLDVSPVWAEFTGSQTSVAPFADPRVRARLRGDLPRVERTLCSLAIRETDTPELERFRGITLDKVAAELGKDLVDTFCDIMVADQKKTRFFSPMDLVPEAQRPAFDHAGTQALMQDPYVVPGISDGGAHVKYFTGSRLYTELITHCVRDHAWLNLEEAHRRVSGLAAFHMGLGGNRGLLVRGAPADIIVYDYGRLGLTAPEVVTDLPGGEWRVTQGATGYRYVLVNGRVTIEDDQQTEVHSGQLLRQR